MALGITTLHIISASSRTAFFNFFLVEKYLVKAIYLDEKLNSFLSSFCKMHSWENIIKFMIKRATSKSLDNKIIKAQGSIGDNYNCL